MHSSNYSHEYFMSLALAQAQTARDLDEIPVGAVITYENQVIATGFNQTILKHDPSAHAEMVALRRAGQALGNYRLIDCNLYVTLEPCAMCAMALIHARIKNLYFGAFDNKTGACGSAFDFIYNRKHNHQIYVHGGILQKSCSLILSEFFFTKRMEKKRKRLNF